MAASSDNTGSKQGKDTRFKRGQSGNPSGRPQGSKNKTTLIAQALFDGEAEALTRKVIELAKDGDMQALKICVDRLCPPIKAQCAKVQIDLKNKNTLVDIANAFVQAAADGSISPDIAAQLVSSVGTLARIKETDELKIRISALEAAVGKS